MEDTTQDDHMRINAEAERIALEDASDQEKALKRLKQALADKKLIIVTGAGVTLDATGYVPGGELERLRWKGLIEHGFRYLERKCKPAESDQKKTTERWQKINNGRLFLSQSEIESHLYAAQILRKELEDENHFATWLDSVFDELPIKNETVLAALRALHRKGATLLTTNYDHLLDRYCGLETIHRSATKDLLRFRRGRAFKDGVFHIHGSYQNPDDVILDPIDYYKVKVSPEVQDFLRKCLQDDLVLFVGCGDGLGDANFSALLGWITNKHRTIAHSHCLLVTNNDSYHFTPLVKLKYGADHGDLGPWLLTKLLERPPKTETSHSPPGDTEKAQALRRAASNGDSQRLSDLLESYPELVNAVDPRDGTALQVAAVYGNFPIVQLLLSKGADVNLGRPLFAAIGAVPHPDPKARVLRELLKRQPDITNPHLLYQAASRDPAAVEALLDAGADVNGRLDNGETALQIAATHGKLSVVQMLLSKGADVNLGRPLFAAIGAVPHPDPKARVLRELLKRQPDITNPHLLYQAASRDPAAVEALLDAGADVNGRLDNGETALQIAAAHGKLSIVQMLLSKGADVNLGRPLFAAIGAVPHPDPKARVLRELLKRQPDITNPHLLYQAASRDPAAVEALLDAGADVNGRLDNGETALQNAAAHGKLPIVQMLLSKGADVDLGRPLFAAISVVPYPDAKARILRELLQRQPDITDPELLCRAASQDPAAVEALLDAGADVNGRLDNGETALQIAAAHGKLPIVQMLLSKGADVDLGRPLFAAIGVVPYPDPKARILRELLQRQPDITDSKLLCRAASQDPAAVEALLDAGADVNGRLDNGETALQIAAAHGKLLIVQMLLSKGADVNLGRPLFAAISVVPYPDAKARILRELLQRQPDITDPELLCQAARRAPTAVEVLLDAGADVNALNDLDETPLYVAAVHGVEAVVALLLSRGVDKNIGKEAVTAAQKSGHRGIVRLLNEQTNSLQV